MEGEDGMQSKKIIASVLSFSLLTFTAGTVLATDSEEVVPIKAVSDNRAIQSINENEVTNSLNENEVTQKSVSQNEVPKSFNEKEEIRPISEEIDAVQQSQFNFFTGKVKEINEVHGNDDVLMVSVENGDNQLANIVISNDTYVLGDNEPEVGSVITGFYDIDAPMIMIYPPQYSADVVVVEGSEETVENIKVDFFDENLVSQDQSLKLNPSEETEVILKNGETFTGDLKNKNLAVIYDVSTRSIPAITNPTKIIVLAEAEAHQKQGEKKEEKQGEIEILPTNSDISKMEIVVENQKIEAPAAYLNDEGTVMVPIRAIAEALGFEVTWVGATRSVTVGKGISLTIGEDNYKYMRTAPIELGTAPTLSAGVTHVPLNFFTEVVRINNAYVFEGQIVIDDGEKLE